DPQPATTTSPSSEVPLLHAQLRTLKAIAEASTHQDIVAALFNELSVIDITICSLWLFGPNEHQRAHGPFNYVELAGLRTKATTPGTDILMRVPIRFRTPLYEHLSTGRPLLSTSTDDVSLDQNPLMRTLLKSTPVANWVICPLNTDARQFGLIFVGSEREEAFTPAIVESMNVICTHIAMKAALLVLQQEQSRSRYERTALLNTVRDGILLTQTGSDGASVLAVNERFKRLFNCQVLHPGMQLDVLLNQMQIPPSVRHNLTASWRYVSVNERDIQHGTFEMVTFEGQPVEIVWYSAPMINPDTNDVFSRLFIFHDATPERAAVQVRSAFLSRVSHELRTPLTSISGFTQFILEATGDDLPDLAKEYLTIINDSAGKLKQIFTELIEITRAYAGEIQLDLHAVHMEETIRSVLRQYEAAADGKKQHITVVAEDNVPVLQADGVKIGRVISSLISNAIKFTPEEGRILVEIALANTSTDLPPYAPPDVMTPAVVVKIIDDGEGVPESDIEAIFEPFHRAKNASAQQIVGAGLGLALSRSLIDLHRGHIWVQPVSKKSTGGKFFFTVPVSTIL
ncbi:MAG: ATP-binding protein, partial [Chloroflexota bacterium]